jgi:hypothetical protein
MSGTGGTDWRINEVSTEVIVTDAVGTLSAEETRRIVALALEHFREEQRRSTQRERDTSISDRAYHSDVE